MDYKENVKIDWYAKPEEFKKQIISEFEQFKFNIWQSRHTAYSKFRNLNKEIKYFNKV